MKLPGSSTLKPLSDYNSSPPPWRILVVGTSCSGKTTLGRQLANHIQLPYIDLDDLHWLPNWKERSAEAFRADLEAFVYGHEQWIISGNYTSRTRNITWQNATHIIWLNYSLPTLVWSYLKRTSHRIITQTPVCNGNYESIYNTFFADEPLLPWILKQHGRYANKFRQWMEGDLKEKTWIEINNRKQINTLTGKVFVTNAS